MTDIIKLISQEPTITSINNTNIPQLVYYLMIIFNFIMGNIFEGLEKTIQWYISNKDWWK